MKGVIIMSESSMRQTNLYSEFRQEFYAAGFNYDIYYASYEEDYDEARRRYRATDESDYDHMELYKMYQLAENNLKVLKLAWSDHKSGFTPSQTSGSSTSSRGGGGCYIATCVYGTYDCPEVWVLRRFRDNTLSISWLGKGFIRAYYSISPKVVNWFGGRRWFNRLFKTIIGKIVTSLRNNGVSDNPYTDY
jgi:hypothetical protein